MKSNSIGRSRSGGTHFSPWRFAARADLRCSWHARAALDGLDRELPFIQPQTMEQVIRDSLGQQRLTMSLLGAFSLLALLVTLIGIYGAVAYTVEQRTGEIGLRMALGAQARDVLRLIISQGMQPVMIGLLLGLGTPCPGRTPASQLYEVSAHSPTLLAGTTFLLGTVAIAACLIPARRAIGLAPSSPFAMSEILHADVLRWGVSPAWGTQFPP